MRHVIDVLFVLAFFGLGILGVMRPHVIIEWAKRAHPQLTVDDKAVLLLARLIGAGIFCFAVFFAMIILRSF